MNAMSLTMSNHQRMQMYALSKVGKVKHQHQHQHTALVTAAAAAKATINNAANLKFEICYIIHPVFMMTAR